MKKIIFLALGISGMSLCQAQNIGINSSGIAADPSAMLDVLSTNTGLLIPRVALTGTTDAVTIASPAPALFVYNTSTAGVVPNNVVPGFYYNSGTTGAPVWVRMANGNGNAWLTTGNTLTGGEKLGSLNSQPLSMYSNNLERLRFTTGANGEITLNQPGGFAYFAGDIFASYVAGANSAINGYSSGTGFAGYFNNSSTGFSVYGINNSTGWGVYGYTSSAAAARPGVFGICANTNGTGIVGLGNGLAGYSTLVAGSGGAFSGSGCGVYGFASTAASGTGGIFAGNNVGATSLVAGSGSASIGTTTGAYNKATTVASGTGTVSAGNNSGASILGTGAGGAFTGVTDGLLAVASSAGVAESIYTSEFGNVVRVNYWNGGTQFKIAGGGTMPVSCSVKDDEGIDRTLYCSESPDFYFEDYGQGKLIAGKAHIDMDELLAKHVIIDDKHPLRVYIQIEDDENCKGVVVKNKTKNGFDVIEMMGGNSSATFQWHIVCNVADAKLEGGRISHLSDIRFQPMGQKRQIVEQIETPLEIKKTDSASEVKKQQTEGGR